LQHTPTIHIYIYIYIERERERDITIHTYIANSLRFTGNGEVTMQTAPLNGPAPPAISVFSIAAMLVLIYVGLTCCCMVLLAVGQAGSLSVGGYRL
jgi:hypothetical protein